MMDNIQDYSGLVAKPVKSRKKKSKQPDLRILLLSWGGSTNHQLQHQPQPTPNGTNLRKMQPPESVVHPLNRFPLKGSGEYSCNVVIKLSEVVSIMNVIHVWYVSLAFIWCCSMINDDQHTHTCAKKVWNKTWVINVSVFSHGFRCSRRSVSHDFFHVFQLACCCTSLATPYRKGASRTFPNFWVECFSLIWRGMKQKSCERWNYSLPCFFVLLNNWMTLKITQI